MSLAAFLRRIVGTLDECGVTYMLTGSLAAAYYAAPRATQDINVVIDGSRQAFERIIDRFLEDGLYVSPEAAREALDHRGQFNVIDPETGWKVDLIVRKERAFSRTEFERRRVADVLGIGVSLVSPEDLVLAKLEWAAMGESERQIRDVVDMLRGIGGELDRSYVERWVHDLGIEGQWKAALSRVSPGEEESESG